MRLELVPVLGQAAVPAALLQMAAGLQACFRKEGPVLRSEPYPLGTRSSVAISAQDSDWCMPLCKPFRLELQNSMANSLWTQKTRTMLELARPLKPD